MTSFSRNSSFEAGRPRSFSPPEQVAALRVEGPPCAAAPSGQTRRTSIVSDAVPVAGGRFMSSTKWNFTVVFVTHSVFESVFLSERIVVMAARPGRIIEDIEVAAPYPRDNDYRTSPLYNEHCRSASAALESAMAHHAHHG